MKKTISHNSKYRVVTCEHTERPVLQLEEEDGNWLCMHTATVEQDEREAQEYLETLSATGTTSFDLRITREQAEAILRMSARFKGGTAGMGFDVMCKEYGEDNNDDPDAWTGMAFEDLEEDGTLNGQYRTLELWFNPNNRI